MWDQSGLPSLGAEIRDVLDLRPAPSGTRTRTMLRGQYASSLRRQQSRLLVFLARLVGLEHPDHSYSPYCETDDDSDGARQNAGQPSDTPSANPMTTTGTRQPVRACNFRPTQ